MFSWFLNGFTSIHWIVALIVTAVAPFLTTYLITSRQASTAFLAVGPNRRPPVVPYFLPYVGHGINWVWDLERFVRDNVARYGSFGIDLPGMRWYIISGPEAIGALLRKSRELTGNSSTILAMKNAFGTPPHALKVYEADDSGLYQLPLPNSSTKPEDRIFYIIHGIVNSYLSGDSLVGVADRFMSKLSTNISQIQVADDDWLETPDLYVFLRGHIMKASIEALFGEHIIALNPTIVDDFWIYDKGVLKLFQEIPRWVDPAIHRAREKMIDHIARWHESAAKSYDCLAESPDGGPEWEPFWGARIMRVRQREFSKMKNFDARARAAEDLGFFWAANANAIPAASWVLLETISDPSLKTRVIDEVDSCIAYADSTLPEVDMARFLSSPLLQSMYAETLRVRVDVMIARQPLQDDFRLEGWSFQKEHWIGFMNKVEARDTAVWNEGKDREHPLDKFWAERFLIFPNDPYSGPVNKGQPKSITQVSKGLGGLESKSSDPKFSMEGLAHSWVPYGGGSRLCPGRHFAKQQMFSTAAIWLAMFEFDLEMPKGWRPSTDRKFIGFGTIPPERGIRARVRRRPVKHRSQ